MEPRDTYASSPPPTASVQSVRLQMELARLLDLPFASDHASLDRARTDRTGYLEPGLPEDDSDSQHVTVTLRLSLDTLQRLLDALRATNPDTKPGSATGSLADTPSNTDSPPISAAASAATPPVTSSVPAPISVNGFTVLRSDPLPDEPGSHPGHLVLCERPAEYAPDLWVTWVSYVQPGNDPLHGASATWGHYLDNLIEAEQDYEERLSKARRGKA